MIGSKAVRRTILSAIGTFLTILLTAQSALAGSGTGVIAYPNPAAVVSPGVTELSFRLVNCSRVPENQGFDAWVVKLEGRRGNYLAVKADNLPQSEDGYTFHVGFYSQTLGRCDWHRGVPAVGNPTPSLATNGAGWAVVSVLTKSDVRLSWKECPNTPCEL